MRWPQAGIWDQIMELVAATHDGAVQMIDTSVCTSMEPVSRGNREQQGRSRGKFTGEIHAVVDANRLPVQLGRSTIYLCLFAIASFRSNGTLRLPKTDARSATIFCYELDARLFECCYELLGGFSSATYWAIFRF